MQRAGSGCRRAARSSESPRDARGGESAPDAADNSSDAADLAPGLAALLRTGVRVELVVEVEVTRPGSGTVRVSAGSCAVAFDLWDEIYRIQVPAGSSNNVAVMTPAGVVRWCTDRSVYGRATSQIPPGPGARRIVRQK